MAIDIEITSETLSIKSLKKNGSVLKLDVRLYIDGICILWKTGFQFLSLQVSQLPHHGLLLAFLIILLFVSLQYFVAIVAPIGIM